MKMNPKFLLIRLLVLLSLPILLTSCDGELLYRVLVAIYDAPIDDPLYADTFVTIEGIEINGKELDDFNGPKTINISNLQNGILFELVKDAGLPSGEYDEMTLLLNYDEDDQGEAPGCYLNTSYGRKLDLSNGLSGIQKITLNKDLNLSEDATNRFIIDFDLRKTIKNGGPGDQEDMVFVSPSGIAEGLRLVNQDETGTLKGSITLPSPNSFTVNYFAVYAYKKGTFDRSSEEIDVDGDGIPFENAVTSTSTGFNKTGSTREFSMYYLEEGEYDLVFEAYSQIEFSASQFGFAVPTATQSITYPITIKAGEETTINLDDIEIIP
ncbi:MAG: DUF4382 domain-containing protein [Bacteroidota bacterium]